MKGKHLFMCKAELHMGMHVAQTHVPGEVDSAPALEDARAQTWHMDWKLSSLSAQTSAGLDPHNHTERQECCVLSQRTREIGGTVLCS